jgi:hypothetical protein
MLAELAKKGGGLSMKHTRSNAPVKLDATHAAGASRPGRLGPSEQHAVSALVSAARAALVPARRQTVLDSRYHDLTDVSAVRWWERLLLPVAGVRFREVATAEAVLALAAEVERIREAMQAATVIEAHIARTVAPKEEKERLCGQVRDGEGLADTLKVTNERLAAVR